MPEVVTALVFWLLQFTSYPRPETLPTVTRLPHAELEQMACGRPCPVLGLYAGGEVIYLDDSLDPEHDRWARSVLLHELVHYVQKVNGRYDDMDPCDAYNFREREAYGVQNRYLARIGEEPRAGVHAQIWCFREQKSP